MSSHLPSGTVTFLFTDIEGSTQQWERRPEAMKAALAQHDVLLRQTIVSQGGYVFKTVGDAFHAAFPTAPEGLLAALSAQRALQSPIADLQIKVRMALHTGAAEERDGDYFGPPLNRVARLLSAGHGGQTLLSLATQELVRDLLPEGISLRDLGERRLKDLIRSEHIFQLNAPDLTGDFPPLKTLDTFHTNLPAQLTSFVGREKEMAELHGLIAAHRLVMLVGPGGTGKTRLSLQVAADLLDSFPDGVWFVELASLADPALVPPTVATVLGVREETNRSILATLTEVLQAKTALLILDNCEHLVEACVQLVEALLRVCPRVKILASSRETLGIAGEAPYRVPSLSLPDTRHPPPLEALIQYEAVQLFIERARATLPTFTVTNDNAPAVAQVCRRLDGIPLAIELAAARVKVLRVEQITQRLDDRFRLLTGGSRSALPRQQTLRALIDWSWELLSDSERGLLRQLSAFAGGWTLEAAESVCAGDGIAAYDVLDLLTQLANKSLVNVEREQGAETRYRLLETIRQYAREKLLEAEEGEPVRDRHLDYFTRLAEQAEPELTQARQVAWLNRLEDEMDNMRAALEWAQESQVEKGQRLGSAIWRFSLRQGYTTELVEQLSQLLAHPAAARTSARAKALTATSILLFWQNNLVRAHALAEESLIISQELGDRLGEAASLYALGTAAAARGDRMWEPLYQQSLALYRSLKDSSGISETLIILGDHLVNMNSVRARACLEEALALCRARGDVISMAGALDNLGNLALGQGDFAQAHAWLEESLAIQRPLGAPGYASTLDHLGELAMREGDYAQARAYGEEGLAMSQQAGLALNVLWVLARLGYIELYAGQVELAHSKLMEALRRFAEVDRNAGVIYTVEGLASVAVRQKQPERAVRLLAWADTTRAGMGDYQRPPVEQADVDRDISVIRAQLDEAAIIVAQTEGRGMTMEQAIAYAQAGAHH